MKKEKDIDIIDDSIDVTGIDNIEEIAKENVDSIAKELEHVKCPKCGYMNFELTKKCTKCHYDLDFINKSCPKCGRINANAVKRCECGFNFNRKKRTLLGNLIFTLLIMALMFVAFHFYGDVLEEYDMAVKVVCIYGVFVLVCKMLVSSHNPKENLSAEHEILEKYKRKSNPIVTRNILIILGFIAAVGFLVYYYYFR